MSSKELSKKVIGVKEFLSGSKKVRNTPTKDHLMKIINSKTRRVV